MNCKIRKGDLSGAAFLKMWRKALNGWKTGESGGYRGAGARIGG